MESWALRVFSRSALVLLTFGALLAFTTCQEGPKNPVNVTDGDFPAPPIDIKIESGDRTVRLSWNHSNVEEVASFKVYRQDSLNRQFRNIGSSTTTSFVDDNLQNGIEYRYRITSVGVNGFEGTNSTIISGIPAIFSVLINSGQQFTNSRNVTLTFGAPARTTLMKISNDSLFADLPWINFASPVSHTLTSGEGLKTVYVKFRDAQDRESIDSINDNITLDTMARIRLLAHDATDRILSPADTVHFVMNTEEAGGRASVTINNIQQGIELFDNGTNGDSTPNDGRYETDYIVPTGPEAENTLVVGSFVDGAGNVAPNFNASSRITIRNPPTPVQLIAVEPVVGSSTSLNLFWSRNSDSDFANYRIYRSLTSGVNLNSSPLVTIIQDRNVTSFTDTNLSPNTRYFYRVYVFDTSGLFFGSNEVSATTNSN